MTYVDSSDTDNQSVTQTNSLISINRMMSDHSPRDYSKLDKNNTKKQRPLCMICSMDEMAKAQVMKLSSSKSRNRKVSRRTKNLVKCMHPDCNIVAHSTIPEEGKVSSLKCFSGMTCFEISHHQRCKNLFVNIRRMNESYCRTIPSHAVVQEVKDLYQSDLPRRSTRTQIIIPRRVGRPATTIHTCGQQDEIDSLTTITGLKTPTGTPQQASKQQTAIPVALSKKKRTQATSK